MWEHVVIYQMWWLWYIKCVASKRVGVMLWRLHLYTDWNLSTGCGTSNHEYIKENSWYALIANVLGHAVTSLSLHWLSSENSLLYIKCERLGNMLWRLHLYIALRPTASGGMSNTNILIEKVLWTGCDVSNIYCITGNSKVDRNGIDDMLWRRKLYIVLVFVDNKLHLSILLSCGQGVNAFRRNVFQRQ